MRMVSVVFDSIVLLCLVSLAIVIIICGRAHHPSEFTGHKSVKFHHHPADNFTTAHVATFTAGWALVLVAVLCLLFREVQLDEWTHFWLRRPFYKTS